MGHLYHSPYHQSSQNIKEEDQKLGRNKVIVFWTTALMMLQQMLLAQDQATDLLEWSRGRAHEPPPQSEEKLWTVDGF